MERLSGTPFQDHPFHQGVPPLHTMKQVIQVQKLVGLPPPHSNYFDVYLRLRRTFAEVIMFGGASVHEF